MVANKELKGDPETHGMSADDLLAYFLIDPTVSRGEGERMAAAAGASTATHPFTVKTSLSRPSSSNQNSTS